MPRRMRRLAIVSGRQSTSTAEPLAQIVRQLADQGTHMLIDEENGNVLPLFRELVKGALDCAVLRFGIHDEIVLLRVGRVGDVLPCNVRQESTRDRDYFVVSGGTYADAGQEYSGHRILCRETVLVGFHELRRATQVSSRSRTRD